MHFVEELQQMSEFSIRPLSEKDTNRMLEWMRDADITQYLQIGGPNTTREQVLAFIHSTTDESESLHRAIVNERDEYLGTVSLKHIDRDKKEAEYAISMHPSALGTGASAEGTRLILKLAFQQLGLVRIYLYVQEENQRAVRFYKKIGFQLYDSSIGHIKNEDKNLLWFEVQEKS